jgi:AcrR family transcriptional regulator
MSERKQEILQVAIEIIATEGYSKLSMRALARASGMKLGALQYHFRTREEMLQALVGYIVAEYQRSFDRLTSNAYSPGIREIVVFLLDDSAGYALHTDRLWPQLWAMALVEPILAELVEAIYAQYLLVLETALKDVGSPAPRAEALCLMSMVEGSALFLHSGSPWAGDKTAVRDSALGFIDAKYGEKQ